MGSKLCCTSRYKVNYRRRKESKPYGLNRKLCSRAMVFIKTAGKVCRYVLLLLTFYYHVFVIPLDGQYLASRLSKSISSQSSLLKRLLVQYNSLPSVASEGKVTWAEATNLLPVQWLGRGLECGVHVPKKVKFDAMKHHHMLLRCDEEIKMIGDEMRSCVSFYLKDWKELNISVKEMLVKPCTKFINGALSALQLERLRCEGTLTKLVTLFGPYIDIEPLEVDQFLSIPDDLHQNVTGIFFYCY